MANGGIFVYVSCGDAKEIFVLQLDVNSGCLALIQQIPVGGNVHPMAISPDRRFLYAAIRSEPYLLSSFAISPLTGALTHLANVPLAGTMAYISTDRTGRFLFSASIPEPHNRTKQSGVISVNAIGPQGFVQPAHQIIRTPPKMHAIFADPTNQYVFATSNLEDCIVRYNFDEVRGEFLSPAPLRVRVKPNAGPRHFVFHPNNGLLYLINETDASIYTFQYDSTEGTLTEYQIVDILRPSFTGPPPMAADLHITPDGHFLYASERISNTIAAFKIDLLNGSLSSAGIFTAPNRPLSFNIDPYGRNLLCGGQHAHSITTYSIDSTTGILTTLEDFPVGRGPNWIEIVRLP